MLHQGKREVNGWLGHLTHGKVLVHEPRPRIVVLLLDPLGVGSNGTILVLRLSHLLLILC